MAPALAVGAADGGGMRARLPMPGRMGAGKKEEREMSRESFCKDREVGVIAENASFDKQTIMLLTWHYVVGNVIVWRRLSLLRCNGCNFLFQHIQTVRHFTECLKGEKEEREFVTEKGAIANTNHI